MGGMNVEQLFKQLETWIENAIILRIQADKLTYPHLRNPDSYVKIQILEIVSLLYPNDTCGGKYKLGIKIDRSDLLRPDYLYFYGDNIAECLNVLFNTIKELQ